MASWRRQQRQQLLATRQALPKTERERIQSLCLSYVSDHLAQCLPGILGLYWPIKRELDCTKLAEPLLAQG